MKDIFKILTYNWEIVWTNFKFVYLLQASELEVIALVMNQSLSVS